MNKTSIFLTLLLNGIIPWALYAILSNYVDSFAALCIATLVPLVENIAYVVKHKKLDAFGGIMLFTFLLSIALALLGGNEKLLLIRESFVTSGVGLLFIVSLFFPRPLIFHLAMRFTVGKDEESRGAFVSNWVYPYFRSVLRLMSAVWGLALLSEGIIRIVLVYELSTEEFLAVSNLILYGIVGATIIWTMVYRKHAGRKLAKLKEAIIC